LWILKSKLYLVKIAFWSAFGVPHIGGIENYTERLSKELVNSGHQVINVIANWDGKHNGRSLYEFERSDLSIGTQNKEDSQLKKKNERNGIIIYRLPIIKKLPSRYPVILKNQEFRKILQELKNEKMDAIICNTRFHATSLIGAKFGFQNQIPVFCIEHGSAPLTLDNPFFDFFLHQVENYLTRKLIPYVDQFYVVSKAASKNLWEMFRIRSSGEWNNCIDMDGESGDFSKPMNVPEFKKGSDPIEITYAGRILKQKGLDVLIEGVADYIQKTPEDKRKSIHLNIIGDGNYLEQLKNQFGNKEWVTFYGRQTPEFVEKMLEKTSIVVFLVLHPEGLPTLLLEAGKYYCLVISTNKPGVNEVIQNNETGIFVEPNSNSLSKALNKILLCFFLQNNHTVVAYILPSHVIVLIFNLCAPMFHIFPNSIRI